MLNQVVLVGRLSENVVERDDNTSIITLAIPRSYKNENGIYETDFVSCYLSGVIASNTAQYCKKGDIVGVKGKIETQNNEIRIIAEKITFLSSHSE